jgi:hypothetical protein
MDEALRRAGWIVVMVIAGSYVTFLGGDYVFNKDVATSSPILIDDVIRKDQHHLYGKIIVSKSCLEVTLDAKKITERNFILAFSTWEEPGVKCKNEYTERVFNTTIFAHPEDVEFAATLDTEPLPIIVRKYFTY